MYNIYGKLLLAVNCYVLENLPALLYSCRHLFSTNIFIGLLCLLYKLSRWEIACIKYWHHELLMYLKY